MTIYLIGLTVIKSSTNVTAWLCDESVYMRFTLLNCMRRKAYPFLRLYLFRNVFFRWFHFVYLFQGIAYRLNLRTRVCNVTALTSPFRRVGIPTFAKFRGEGYIGASVPNAGVLVSLWDGATPDGGKRQIVIVHKSWE